MNRAVAEYFYQNTLAPHTRKASCDFVLRCTISSPFLQPVCHESMPLTDATWHLGLPSCLPFASHPRSSLAPTCWKKYEVLHEPCLCILYPSSGFSRVRCTVLSGFSPYVFNLKHMFEFAELTVIRTLTSHGPLAYSEASCLHSLSLLVDFAGAAWHWHHSS